MQTPDGKKGKKYNYNKLLLVLVSVLALLLFGCAGFLTSAFNAAEASDQDKMISSAFQNATPLLEFQDITLLKSFSSNYAAYSAIINTGCDKLNQIDKEGKETSNITKLICQNRKGIDDCFFYIEKTKMTLKNNNNADINLDSAEVLCRDLRSLGLDAKLNNEFVSKYKGYTTWRKAEGDIDKQWQNVQQQVQNYSYEPVGRTSLSDSYNSIKNSMDSAKTSLQQIKKDCASRNGFDSASGTAELACSKVDTYISDMEKTNKAMKSLFTFASKFETGTLTVDSGIVNECRNSARELSGLYDLALFKDSGNGSKTDVDFFGSTCDGLEQLADVSSSLGIPVVFENGKLSTNTKIGFMKAKTVYIIQTDRFLGSGVLVGTDGNGYYVLTNAHVALNTDPDTGVQSLPGYVRVKFYDGRIGYASKLRFNKEHYDLALLYVPLSLQKYPTATFSETNYPAVGTPVVAVGNPYGLEFTVTQGTVSAIRNIGCFTDYCYGAVIQTDTAINPGNSGGGLWDFESGDLLGINSLGRNGAQGLNFAISMVQYAAIKILF
ncbi:trypsin-like peptidase domain-containing protein [Candidatus Micrarchaeota archaeon]|nr:trypsin-like peptidase domain-containing protein [Candidatus Micrarchaeota archaeon]